MGRDSAKRRSGLSGRDSFIIPINRGITGKAYEMKETAGSRGKVCCMLFMLLARIEGLKLFDAMATGASGLVKNAVQSSPLGAVNRMVGTAQEMMSELTSDEGEVEKKKEATGDFTLKKSVIRIEESELEDMIEIRIEGLSEEEQAQFIQKKEAADSAFKESEASGGEEGKEPAKEGAEEAKKEGEENPATKANKGLVQEVSKKRELEEKEEKYAPDQDIFLVRFSYKGKKYLRFLSYDGLDQIKNAMKKITKESVPKKNAGGDQASGKKEWDCIVVNLENFMGALHKQNKYLSFGRNADGSYLFRIATLDKASLPQSPELAPATGKEADEEKVISKETKNISIALLLSGELSVYKKEAAAAE